MGVDRTVVCPGCEGLTFVVAPCQCRYTGDTLLVTESALLPVREPYPACEMCAGTGGQVFECFDCGGQGRRPVGVSLTVVNLATAQTASKLVTPGMSGLLRSEGGYRYLDCQPVIAGLAESVGLTLEDLAAHPTRDPSLTIGLPEAYDPHGPTDERLGMEAAAIAAMLPWTVFAARPGDRRPDADTVLASLCEAAERLRLDLVIERRVIEPEPGTIGYGRYDVRFEVPGATPPVKPAGCFDDLAWALDDKTESTLLRDLRGHSQPMPAHFLHTGHSAPQHRAVTEPVAEIANRIERLCTDHPAAAAIWRERRWHYTPLRACGAVENITRQLTGQYETETVTLLARPWEPPAPSYLGEAIPTRPCPDCAGSVITEPCLCSDGVFHQDDCGQCSGSGRRPVMSCGTCAGIRLLYNGAVLTIRDGDHTLHVNWPAPHISDVRTADIRTVDDTTARPRRAVHNQYSAAYWARYLGADPAALTDDGIGNLDDLTRGTTRLSGDGADLVAAYLQTHTTRRPGARIFLQIAAPEMTLAEVLRVAFVLDLAVDITIRRHRPPRQPATDHDPDRWGIRLALPSTSVNWWGGAARRLDLAAAELMHDLPLTVTALLDRSDPHTPLPTPQATDPPDPDTFGYVALLTQAADYLTELGEDLLVRLTADRATIYGLGLPSDAVRCVSTGPDVRAAVAALYPSSGSRADHPMGTQPRTATSASDLALTTTGDTIGDADAVALEVESMFGGRDTPLIDRVGGILLAILPGDAHSITARARIADDWDEISFTFLRADGTTGHFDFDDHPDEAAGDITETLAELRDVMSSTGQEPWHAVQFTVDQGRQVRMTFSYDADDDTEDDPGR